MANRNNRAAQHNRASQEVWRRGAWLLGFLGFWILILGVTTLTLARLHYPNYWGGPDFAPFALVIGVLGIVLAIRISRCGR
jgi:hypothetical protein